MHNIKKDIGPLILRLKVHNSNNGVCFFNQRKYTKDLITFTHVSHDQMIDKPMES